MDQPTRQKFKARLILRQPVYDKSRNLVDYQWDSCEVEFTSKLSHPTVAGAEMVGIVGLAPVEITLPQELIGKGISELNLSVRAMNCLLMAGIKKVGDLANKHPVEMRKCKGVGLSMIQEYQTALAEIGIEWG